MTLWPCDCGVLISHPGTLVRCPNCDASITELGEPVTAYLPKGVRLVGLTERQSVVDLTRADIERILSGTQGQAMVEVPASVLRSALSKTEEAEKK